MRFSLGNNARTIIGPTDPSATEIRYSYSSQIVYNTGYII